MERVSKRQYYLDIAAEVARRSTCLRRQYGAVIVKNDEIVATGYNGAPRGDENCCDVGVCWRDAHGIPHGEQYEKCVAVHAECNVTEHCDETSVAVISKPVVSGQSAKRYDCLIIQSEIQFIQ